MTAATITREDQITAACQILADEPGDYIWISDIADATWIRGEELARVLIRMYEDQKIDLAPSSNQDRRVLTQERRAAGITCGGEVRHRVAITR